MACIFLFLSPRMVSLFKNIRISFWNLFLNHFKCLSFEALVRICIFKLILKSGIFEKSLKTLIKIILVWPQFKFGLKVFEIFYFKTRILLWKGFLVAHYHLSPNPWQPVTIFLVYFSCRPCGSAFWPVSVIRGFSAKTEYSSYAWPKINCSTHTAKSAHR
jgi:hypothetical protein